MRRRFSLFSAALLGAALLSGTAALAQDGYDNRQGGGYDNRDSRGGGMNAGGGWSVFQTEDKMTAAKLVRYELESDNTMPDSDRRSKVILYCKNGKLDLSDFRPNLRMAGPNRPGFWGQPQMEVRVRVDNDHDRKGWNWVRGQFLAMDKGTTRELIGAHVFKVEFFTGRGSQIAEFSPAGLDLNRIKHDCDITPKRP